MTKLAYKINPPDLRSDFHSHIAQMPPMPPMNLGKSYGLPDGLQNIQPLVGKRIEFAECIA